MQLKVSYLARTDLCEVLVAIKFLRPISLRVISRCKDYVRKHKCSGLHSFVLFEYFKKDPFTSGKVSLHYLDTIMVLINCDRWFDKNDRTYRGGKLVFSPHIQSLTWHAYRIAFSLLEKFMASVMFKALSNWRPVEITDDELSEIKKLTLNMNSGSGFSNDLDQDVLPGTLGKITCDTLIIHSAYDNSVDTSHALHAKENIPRSQLVLIKNRWGHMLWIGREYQETMEILGRCLNDQHRDRGR